MADQSQQVQTPAQNMTASHDHEVCLLTQDGAETMYLLSRVESHQVCLNNGLDAATKAASRTTAY
jgi:hypothetical protein